MARNAPNNTCICSLLREIYIYINIYIYIFRVFIQIHKKTINDLNIYEYAIVGTDSTNDK